MKYKDYYATLGIARDADLDQVKKAYRKLARKYHPDVSKEPDGEARFKEAAEAYATLKDPDKRAAYDELGRRPAGEEFAPSPQWRNDHASGESFDDMGLADLLAAMSRGQFGSGHTRPRGPVPTQGHDYENTVRIKLEEAHLGTTLSLNIADEGNGHTLEVTIPPGVSEGQRMRLRGKGGKGRNGGADGDHYLHISLKPHPLFRADHRDLYFDLALSPWEAVLGTELEVPTLDEPVMLTVPPGTSSGRKLRLRGRGLAHPHHERGDLYAVVHIESPAILTERERALFQELSASTFNPRIHPGSDSHINSHINPRPNVAKEKPHEPTS